MGHALLVRGSAAQLREALDRHGDRNDLMLIIPEEETTAELTVCAEGPAAAARRNGVALFPTRELPGAVTSEMVKRLVDDEE